MMRVCQWLFPEKEEAKTADSKYIHLDVILLKNFTWRKISRLIGHFSRITLQQLMLNH